MSDHSDQLKTIWTSRELLGSRTKTVPGPIYHREELDEILSEARDNASRENGPMQHIAIIGDRGAGKTFLTYAFSTSLQTSGFRGEIVMLPEFQAHVQSPEQFAREICQSLDVKITPDASWELATQKIDNLFSERSRKRRLLIIVAENFHDLIKRAFPRHGDQAKLRNWLDRAESRVMFVTTSESDDIDNEPEDPLFGFINSIKLKPISTSDLDGVYRLLPEELTTDPAQKLFRFLFLLSSRTGRALTMLAHYLSRHGLDNPRAIIDEFLLFQSSIYQNRLEHLGQRAALCLHNMITEGEPISQSDLARRLGYKQQSAVAQPFSEMRRKGMLVEDPAPGSAAKLASIGDRFFVSFYRRNVLRNNEEIELIVLLAEGLQAKLSEAVNSRFDESCRILEEQGRAKAFVAFAQLIDDVTDGDRPGLIVSVVERIRDEGLLRDLADHIASFSPQLALVLREAANIAAQGVDPPSFVGVHPDARALFEALKTPST